MQTPFKGSRANPATAIPRPLRWPGVNLTLRQLLVAIAVSSLVVGLLLHFAITYFAFRQLNDSFWVERLQRQAAALDGMLWFFGSPQEDSYPDWLRQQFEPAAIAVFRITRVKDENGYETGQIASIARQPSWANRQTLPLMDQARLESALADLKSENPEYQFCTNCNGYRTVVLRGWNYVVHMGIPLSVTNQPITRFWATSAGSSLVAFVLALALVATFSLGLTRPLAALARRSKHLEAPEPIPGLERRDEVGQLARALEAGLNDLERARATEKQFLAAASHELRTPVSALVMGLEQALARPRSAEEAREALKRAYRTALRLSDLSGNLLTLNRAGLAGQPRVELNLLELAAQVADELMPLAVDKGLYIELGGESATFPGDPGAVRQVIANLVSNAIKFTDQGYIRIGVQRSLEWATLSIEDTGIGIPPDPEEARGLLEPFQRGSNASSSRPGAGLGLAVVAEVARVHGGEVRLSRREGGGTRVEVSFQRP